MSENRTTQRTYAPPNLVLVLRVAALICFVAAVAIAATWITASAKVEAALIPAGLAFWVGSEL